MARKRRKVGTRPKLGDLVKRRVWVRSGGRCAICNRDLLDGYLTDEVVSLGELAHIVGQKDSAGSPRGKTKDPFPQAERDSADNILLACGECHDEIDDPATLNSFTVEKLHELKTAHEARIAHVTSLGSDSRTVVLRVLGHVRGRPVELTKKTASEAVIAEGDRFPLFKLAYDRQGIEVDLRPIPGEADGSDEYYRAAAAAIDEVVTTVLRTGLAQGDIEHVSVFAFARVPLLVHLGRRLDDVHGLDVYQRHRSTEKWTWPDTGSVTTFQSDTSADSAGNDQAVLILNISGTVHEAELPENVNGLAVFRVQPVGSTPQPDTVGSKETLGAYKQALRELLAQLEASHKQVKQLHVFPAVPITAAIELGRTVDAVVHPSLTLYDRQDDHTYRAVLDVR